MWEFLIEIFISAFQCAYTAHELSYVPAIRRTPEPPEGSPP